jgi:hypothetical protein
MAYCSRRATGQVVLETSSKGRSISYHVGDIFKEMVPFGRLVRACLALVDHMRRRADACAQSKNFVVYKHYCSNYKKSMDAIQRAKQVPAFADFLRVRA